MNGGFAEGRIVPVDVVELSVDTSEHPWHAANRADVDAHWRREHAARPFLFNGEILMHRGLRLDEGRITGMSHVVPYANLLYFLSREARDGDIWHLFAVPVLVAADGGVLLIRMGGRTANPGRVYSPSGSLDAHDIRDGTCDLDGNMVREVGEEVGLDLGQATAEPQRFLHVSRQVVTVFRRFQFTDDAATIAARMEAHIGAQAESEVAAALVARSADDITDAMPAYMARMLRFHFSRGSG